MKGRHPVEAEHVLLQQVIVDIHPATLVFCWGVRETENYMANQPYHTLLILICWTEKTEISRYIMNYHDMSMQCVIQIHF